MAMVRTVNFPKPKISYKATVRPWNISQIRSRHENRWRIITQSSFLENPFKVEQRQWVCAQTRTCLHPEPVLRKRSHHCLKGVHTQKWVGLQASSGFPTGLSLWRLFPRDAETWPEDTMQPSSYSSFFPNRIYRGDPWCWSGGILLMVIIHL